MTDRRTGIDRRLEPRGADRRKDVAVALSERLYAAMRRRSFSIERLSLESGIGETTILRILKGHNTSVGTLVDLSDALHVTVSALLDDAPHIGVNPPPST